jgi:hypothetical protein
MMQRSKATPALSLRCLWQSNIADATPAYAVSKQQSVERTTDHETVRLKSDARLNAI